MSVYSKVRFFLIVVCCLMPSVIFAQSPEKGERIVFLGDSITQSGALPGGFVSLVRKAVNDQISAQNIEVIGAGISGNRVPDLQERLDRDVLDKKPTLVVIYIGINDVWHSESGRGTSKDDFRSGLIDVISRIQESGARVILCTPSVIGEKSEGSNDLDSMLDEFSQISREVALEKSCQLLDLRKQFVKFLATSNKENAASKVLTTDGVHLNAAGNQFVAKRMLEALSVGSASNKSLRHVVLFKFNEGLDESEVKEVVDAFVDLKNKIDVIDDFEYGTDVSSEDLSDGFTHCFVVTFGSSEDRDAYLPHSAHKAFVKLLKGKVEKVLVIDYWAHD